MKKHSLFKVLLIVLGTLLLVNGGFAILSYFVPAFEGYTMMPIGDVFLNFVQSFYYFFDTVVFLLVLGAFYGVLNEISAYKKLLDNLAQKMKNHGKLFVFIVTILFSVLSSVTGLTNVLLIFVPFVIAIILLLGYDKLVAISSTFVAMLIGFMGGIFVTFRDPNSYYGYSSTTIESIAGIGNYDNIWSKIILLVLGIALLIFFISRHIKNVQDKKVKYELNDSDEVFVSEVKGDYKNIRTWPIFVVFGVMFVVLVLGLLPWNTLFGIECFDKFNEWLLGIKIGEFAIFSNVISGSIYSFGNWASLGTYMSIIITLIIFTLILKVIYRVKFNEVINNFINGSKKMISTVFLVVIAYAILVTAYNHGFMTNVITWVSESKLGMNIGTATLISGLGTLLHSDLYYTVAGVFTTIMSSVTDESMYSVYTITFQSIYGLVSMIAPTSVLLIVALKYFDVPYTTWVKYIWRFILMLFLLVILLLLILALI